MCLELFLGGVDSNLSLHTLSSHRGVLAIARTLIAAVVALG